VLGIGAAKRLLGYGISAADDVPLPDGIPLSFLNKSNEAFPSKASSLLLSSRIVLMNSCFEEKLSGRRGVAEDLALMLLMI